MLGYLQILTLGRVAAWLGVWCAVGFALMGVDKLMAASRRGFVGRRRVSERSLRTVALLGGFVGIAVGGGVFRHKTSKASFWPAVALSSVLWCALLYFLYA